MAFVIAELRIGTKDTACVDACPVDCIHSKKNTTYGDGRPTFDSVPQLYIDPVECIDCGACVPVCPVSAIFALDVLPEKWKLVRREGWVFPSKKSRSGHIGLSALEHMFRKIARKLGIPDALKLYCARHTFGTVAMSETRNPGLVKEVMGHESLDTTMGYLHPETAQIKLVIDRLNQQKCVM